MPPAEGGRQLAPWKVWDGGNTRPPLPLACNVLLCLIHFGLQFLSPCWLIFSLPTAQSQRAGLWSYKKEQAEWSGAWGIPHHKMLCLFRHEKNNNFFFFSLDIRQGDLQKNLSTFHPQKNVVQYFFIKKYTTGIPCSLLFHVLLFSLIIPNSVWHLGQLSQLWRCAVPNLCLWVAGFCQTAVKLDKGLSYYCMFGFPFFFIIIIILTFLGKSYEPKR